MPRREREACCSHRPLVRRALRLSSFLQWTISDFETIRNNLVWYRNNDKNEGRIGLFNSHTCSVEEIAEFHNCYKPYQVATTQNKVNFYVHYFE